MLQSPCVDCDLRTLGCHSDCPSYAAFKILNDSRRTELQEEKYKSYETYVVTRHYQRNKKKRRRPYADSSLGC